jgi:hypothetical protein
MRYTVTAEDIDRIIRKVLECADYDLLKSYESDEMTGEDTVHELVAVAEGELNERAAAPDEMRRVVTATDHHRTAESLLQSAENLAAQTHSSPADFAAAQVFATAAQAHATLALVAATRDTAPIDRTAIPANLYLGPSINDEWCIWEGYGDGSATGHVISQTLVPTLKLLLPVREG